MYLKKVSLGFHETFSIILITTLKSAFCSIILKVCVFKKALTIFMFNSTTFFLPHFLSSCPYLRLVL